jgi:hypothetical protein
MVHHTVRYMLCFCILVFGNLLCGKTLADVAAIADFISKSFPITGATASAGTDWCLEAEVDPHKNWWDFSYGGQIIPHSSEYGTRIRLTYKDKDGNFNFASLFLAIDTNKPDSYNSSAYLAKKLRVQGSNSTTPINFPNSPCSTLADFLTTAFENNITDWFPLVTDPTCDDSATPNGCPTVSGWPSKQTSQTDVSNFLYWNFNGRVHKISGAVRLLINFCTDTPDNCKNARQSNLGYLFIGFGGNGGAG